MDGHLIAAWQTPRSISINVSSTDYQETYYRRRKFLSPRSYDIIFCVPNFYTDDYHMNHTKWYSINIREDGPCEVYPKGKTISSFWDGILNVYDGFAALRSHVYAFGGGPTIPTSLSEVCKLDLTSRGPYSLKRVSPMISPKYKPLSFALDGKIYFFSSRLQHTSPTVKWGEVFDPDYGKWEALPDPPYDSSSIILSAALENPSRILVAFHVPNTRYSAMFYTYNVQHRSWEVLAPPERKIHSMFPVGSCQRTITAHNTLYWATWVETTWVEDGMEEEAFLIAYNLDLDKWLEGSLKHLGISSSPVPCLVHLENKRFCILQTARRLHPLSSDEDEDEDEDEDKDEDKDEDEDEDEVYTEVFTRVYTDAYTDVRCIVVDISHMPGENRLDISLAWEEKYKVDSPFGLTDAFLRPEIKQSELRGED